MAETMDSACIAVVEAIVNVIKARRPGSWKERRAAIIQVARERGDVSALNEFLAWFCGEEITEQE
jgi:hypothetical protein